MRQAGRYLPEYRALRSRYPAFLDLCYDIDAAVEATLQPIRRFGFDAAILFSDILVVPDALGQGVWFEAGEGPKLEPISSAADTARLDRGCARAHLAPVIAAVRRLRVELPDDVALLGFCGAPWTVATYMVAGGGSPDQRAARLFAYRDPEGFSRLIDVLVDASADYLSNQLEAGADAVQVFDTWAGVLGGGAFARWVIEPTRRLVDKVRARVPEARMIGFPRGAGPRIGEYATATGIDAVGIDWTMPLNDAAALQINGLPVQGNLDPLALVAGGDALAHGVADILDTLGGGPLIFNLGHGVVPESPPEHVAELVARVRAAG